MIDANDHRALARWWSEALSSPIVGEKDDEAWLTIEEGLEMVFVPVDEPKTVKDRVHLDLSSGSASDQGRIVERLISLGATHADIGQGATPWVVLADPEGNEFCVLEPREMYAQSGTLAAVVIDAVDPAGLAAFWSEATSWPIFEAQEWGTTLRAASGVGPTVDFISFGDPKIVKNRLHLDLAPIPDGDTQIEAERLVSFGALRIDIGQGKVPWVVLVDPEGNEFCVLTPR